ncbi:MAG: DUF4198 domain-containing protein [Gemmatimonadales bacterium]|nr:DUF4198 domain-containing protein [Gemmatimonadales bacterium]
MSGSKFRPYRVPVVVTIATAAVAAAAFAHDMFLKPSQFFVAANSSVPTILLNGTFDKSMNSITRIRLADVSVVSPAGRARIDTAAWNPAGDTSHVSFKVGAAGTYVFGVSTKPSEIELEAKDFNDYLKEDGQPDELARRQKSGEMNADAKERYEKHVKTIVQVGEARSDGFAAVLGYPAEIVPVDNPYALPKGGALRVRALVDGKPVGNQLFVFGARTASGSALPEKTTRADANGVAVRVNGRRAEGVSVVRWRRSGESSRLAREPIHSSRRRARCRWAPACSSRSRRSDCWLDRTASRSRGKDRSVRNRPGPRRGPDGWRPGAGSVDPTGERECAQPRGSPGRRRSPRQTAPFGSNPAASVATHQSS